MPLALQVKKARKNLLNANCCSVLSVPLQSNPFLCKATRSFAKQPVAKGNKGNKGNKRNKAQPLSLKERGCASFPPVSVYKRGRSNPYFPVSPFVCKPKGKGVKSKE